MPKSRVGTTCVTDSYTQRRVMVIHMRDPEVRRLLKEALVDRHSREPDTIVVEELGLCRGSVRADIAVVNGIMKGYEIKSDRDTLDRLLTQVQVYGRVFDAATLVTAERHLSDARTVLPSWWGIEVVCQNGPLVEFRPSRPNPLLEPEALALLLWRDEAISLLNGVGIATYRSDTRQIVCSRLARILSLDELRTLVRTTLKSRSDERFRSQRLRGGGMFQPSATSLDSPSRPARPRSRQYTYRPS